LPYRPNRGRFRDIAEFDTTRRPASGSAVELAPGKLLIRAAAPFNSHGRRIALLVTVRDNNVEQALKALKKKLQREGVFREMKRRRAYEKPSEKRVREANEAIRRCRKAARKLAQREGLLPKPRSKRKITRRR